MNRIVAYLFICGSLILPDACSNHAPVEKVTVSNLTCEGLENPAGIDDTNPRLSWQLTSGERNTVQRGYRILAATSRVLLEQDSADLWDTGEIRGDQSAGVIYGGDPLHGQEQVFWKVKAISNQGSSSWSEIQHFRTGLLFQNKWEGRWIGFDRAFPWDREEMFSRLSARYFRKEFKSDPARQIRDATLYIMGLGLYELYLNGHKVGTQVLAPAPTDYTKNVKYNCFEVGEMLRPGENAVGVVLGNGRYHTMRQHYKPYKIKNFGYPKVLLNLVIRYSDGTSGVISTDDSWKGTADGPIRSNNEYDGAIYDARKELGEWTRPGFDDSSWLKAAYVQEPGGDYEAQINENMAVMDTLRPASLTRTGQGTFILDMGQNMSGWLKIRVRGERGTTVNIRFAESLNGDGSLFTGNLRDARATDTYILKGVGVEEWQPSFVYHGFRYAELSGFPGNPNPDDFAGMVVYDNLDPTGTFRSSDTLLNRLYSAARWSIRGNYKGMPVDCPQRDERQPWLGDRATGCYGESFLFDNERLYAKWLDDMMYAQRADGSIPDVAPAYFRYYSDNMTWAGTCLLVAEMLYRQYGDMRPVRRHYPHMKQWLRYMEQRYEKEGIMTKDSYGDWCAPPRTIEEGRGLSANVKHPSALISTAYYYHYLDLMQEFASLSGFTEDIPDFRTKADEVMTAFNRTYLSEDRTYYGSNTLTDNILPFAFGMVPEELEKDILSRIEALIREYDCHLSSGMVGVQWLMRTLARNGMQDLALCLATQKTYPGWGYMLENGATTIWELWNGNTAAPDMNSQNHVMMLGDLLIWYYEDLAGIRSHPEFPAFRKLYMRPSFPEGLEHVNATYRSVYGLIESEWTSRGDSLSWHIRIPANTSAEVFLPAADAGSVSESGVSLRKAGDIQSWHRTGDGIRVEIGSGSYLFKVRRKLKKQVTN